MKITMKQTKFLVISGGIVALLFIFVSVILKPHLGIFLIKIFLICIVLILIEHLLILNKIKQNETI